MTGGAGVRSKGKLFEREMAALLGAKPHPHSGGRGEHDLVFEGSGNIFADFAWELKRRHAIPNLVTAALAQSQVELGVADRRKPAMAMRGDGGRAVVAFYADDFVTWATALSEFGQRGKVREYARELERIAHGLREVF